MGNRTRRWAAGCAVVALAGAVMAPALQPTQTLIYRDAIPYQAPQNRLLRTALSEGRLPEWDPGSYAGVPHLASPPAQVLYPPRLACVLASSQPTQPTDYSALFHLLLLAAGAWQLARQLGLRRAARATLSCGLLLAGSTLSALDNQPSLAGIAWLPWGPAVALWALRGQSLRLAAVGAALAAPVYAGAPQEALWSALGAACVLSSCGSTRAKLIRIAITALWSVGLAAAVLGPALALAPYTTRTALSVDEVGTFSLHPLRTLEWVLPFPWGLPFPERGAYLGRAFEPQAGEFWNHTAYFGVGLLLLAVRAFSAGVSARLRRPRAAFAALVGGGLLLAGARHVPGFSVWAATPYGVFRFPEKHLTLVVLGAAGLAALALHTDRPRSRRDAWTGAAVIALSWAAAVTAWLLGPGLAEAARKQAPGFAWLQASAVSLVVVAWWLALDAGRSGSRRRWALCALGVLSALPVARQLVFVGPAELAVQQPPVAAFLAQRRDTFGFPERFYVEPRPFGQPPAELSGGVAVPAMQLLTLRGASANLYGLEGVQGMTGWWPRNLPLLTARPENRADAAAPWWVGPSASASSAPQRVDLPNGVSLVRLPAAPRLELRGARGTLRNVQRRQPEHLRLEVELEAAATLVWRESFYPGWTVTVTEEGRQLAAGPAAQAGIFLAAAVPSGTSEVEFSYRTPGLFEGVATSLGALLLAFGLWVGRSFRIGFSAAKPTEPRN